MISITLLVGVIWYIKVIKRVKAKHLRKSGSCQLWGSALGDRKKCYTEEKQPTDQEQRTKNTECQYRGPSNHFTDGMWSGGGQYDNILQGFFD